MPGGSDDRAVLVDKSALEQRRHSADARVTLESLSREHAFATCEVIALEVLYSARNALDYEELRVQLASQRWLAVDAAATSRALEVQALLVERGQHRLLIADLLIAATAEVNGAEVLHYDRDFDRIAAVTGQRVRWIVPAGTAG